MERFKNMKVNQFYGAGDYVVAYENVYLEQVLEKRYIETEEEFLDILTNTRLGNNMTEIMTIDYFKHLFNQRGYSLDDFELVNFDQALQQQLK